MSVSPFKYGTIVSGKYFTDREDEIIRLKNNFTSGLNTILISPRRWGKSSLVAKAASEISRKNNKIKIAFIDLFSVKSEKDFYEKFAEQVIKASSTAFGGRINDAKNFLRNIVPVFHVKPVPEQEFKISLDWSNTGDFKEEILDLPEKISEKKKIKFVVCIDEFQNLALVNNYPEIEKKLRSYWQKQKHTSYCLYGSKKHMMTEIFNSSDKPFYRFGDIIFLEKIKIEKWVKFIVHSFSSTGKTIDVILARRIAELMDCHPWYVQQFSNYVWNISSEKVTKDDIENANIQVINTNSPLYIRDCENLSATQINLLKAIASNEKQLTSVLVMQKYSLGTPNNVTKNKKLLIKNDFIYDIHDNMSFVDPVFLQWFKKEYSINF